MAAYGQHFGAAGCHVVSRKKYFLKLQEEWFRRIRNCKPQNVNQVTRVELI